MLSKDISKVETLVCDSQVSLREVDQREVLSCSHCRLVQFRTRTSLCRRCHKPLEGEVRVRTEPEASCKRSDPAPMDVSEAIKTLGVRVRGIRMERRLTQSGLAGRMNVPRTYISKVETGRVVPTVTTLVRVAAALEVTMTDLLSDEAERRRNDEAARILADPFLTEIPPMVEKLNSVQRALILRAVLHDAASRRGHHEQEQEEEEQRGVK